MALRGHLIEIEPRLIGGASHGAVVPVRVTSCNDDRVCHLDGLQWDPALAQVPVLSYDFFGGAFQNAIAAPRADFGVFLPALAQVPADLFVGIRFAGAPVRIWTGEVGKPFSDWRLRFAGRIASEPSITELSATFTAAPDDAWLDVPLLQTYAGTDGLEGPEDLTGTAKPLVLGACRFVPGAPIDVVDNVYQVSAYGPVTAITAAYDRLASLGSSFGNYADLAALLAAAIPNGRWATCLAQGLVRLGAPADGKVCFDVTAPGIRAGSMIARIAGIAGGAVDSANLAALDLARPWDQARVIAAQTTPRQIIQELADSVAAVAGISWPGAFFVQPLGFGASAFLLDAAGDSEPLVVQVSQQPVDPPFWRLATSAAITWLVHDRAEIASEFTLRGLYSAARTYRIDDLVSADDGRSFVYINATPAAGNAPPVAPATSNAHWSLVGSATAGAPSGTMVAGLDAAVVASTITPGGLLAPDTVVASSLNNSVVMEIAFAAQSSITATDAGAVLVTVPNVTARPSQGGKVLLLLTCDVEGEPNAAHNFVTGFAILQRSPAGAGAWGQVGSSWRMIYIGNQSQFIGYADVSSPAGEAEVVGGFAQLGFKESARRNFAKIGMGSANQWIDSPPSDGDYDYRVLFSKTAVPGTGTLGSHGAAFASGAELQAMSIKVAV